MGVKLKLLLICAALTEVLGFPEIVTNTPSFVVTSTEQNINEDDIGSKEGGHSTVPTVPKIYEMRIDTNVSNRFAKTLVSSKVKNLAQTAQEATFSVVLPEKAFISKFVMGIDGKNYEAYVKEKDEAKQIYDQAVASGLGAAHVAASARDSNRFTVSVNVEPRSKAVFLLTYEELLERQDNRYELVINIHPKQPVKDLFVSVNINESLPLKFVNAPPIRSGNDISDVKGDLDPRANIKIINSTSAVVVFAPNLERQKELAKTLGTDDNDGLSGQFVVEYDVERNPSGGEILLKDGYFVHFFAPIDIPTLPKNVLFILDTSGSMYGTKIEQLKTAMRSILGELKSQDFFHLVDFNTLVQVLNLQNSSATVKYPSVEPNYYYYNNAPDEDISEKKFPAAYEVNPDNIKRANEVIFAMEANGATNIYDALKVALYLVDEDKRRNPSKNAPQPLIIFLTDGDATVGLTNSEHIVRNVSELNIHSVPIFSLSFGYGADRALLQKLSLLNSGFSRHIYEAADASLQLEDFYRQISSPLLSNVKFTYTEDAKDITKTDFPILFEGSELVVAGTIDKEFPDVPKVRGWGVKGPIDLVPEIRRPVTSLERLWAYLTVQQILDAREVSENKTLYTQKALDLALKYSFVTPVTSLVVVKPNSTDLSVEPEAAEKGTDSTQKFGNVVVLSATYPAPEAAAFAPLSSPPAYRPIAGAPARPSAGVDMHEYAQIFTEESEDTPDAIADKTETITEEPIEKATEPNELEILKIALPWLSSVLSADGTIHTSAGDLKLALNETSTDDVTCPNSPKNGNGVCKYLHECSEVHALLTNVHIFQQYYCPLNGFAAICCPPQSHIH